MIPPRGRKISVTFEHAGRKIRSAELRSIDRGQILEIHGLDLPSSFECHFSKDGGTAWRAVGSSENGVSSVPFYNDQMKTGGIITAYIYLHETEDDGETEYEITIPIKHRPDVTPAEPTPEQEDVIAQAISALNNAVTVTTANVGITEANKNASAQSAQEAQTALNGAQSAQRGAETSARVASDASEYASRMADSASQSARNADLSAQDAERAKRIAVTKADEAERSAIDADTSADDAQGYANDAQTAKNGAETARTGAETARNEAVTAKNEATTAKNDAVTAKNEAVTAKNDAETAQGKAEEAQTKAEEAQDNAEDFAESAQASADRAEQEADRWYEILPVDTASGSLVHITDGAKDVPVKALSVSLEPIQDLHGQDSPYPAGGGSNLLNIEPQSGTVSGVAYSVGSDGYITLNGTAGAACNIYLAQHIAPITSKVTLSSDIIVQAGIYTGLVQQNGSTGILEVSPAHKSRTSGDEGITEETRYRIYIVNGTILNNFKFRIMLNYGDTALDWSPYSNVCPITGHTQVVVTRIGRNLLPYPYRNPDGTKNGVTTTTNADGTLSMHGTGTATQYLALFGYNGTNPSTLSPLSQIGLKAGDTITLSTNYPYFCVIQLNDENGALIPNTGISVDGGGSVTRTISANAKYIYVGLRYRNGEVLNKDDIYVQIEASSTASSYEPYSAQSITIPLGDTVYGGTLDVTNGVLTVDRGMIDMGTITWSKSSATSAAGGSVFSKNVSVFGMKPRQRYEENTMRSDVFMPCPSSTWFVVNMPDNAMFSNEQMLFISASAYETANDFITGMAGHQLCYALATPIEVPLTPQQMTTLLGINNVWSDSGDVSVDYRADVQLFIQKMIANALNA